MMDVKQARDKLGFSQNELAQIVGVSSRTIQNWEAGVSKPKPVQVDTINRLLKMMPDPPAEAREPDTISRLLAIIESQQRVIETLAHEHD